MGRWQLGHPVDPGSGPGSSQPEEAGVRQDEVEDLVGTVADQVESVEGERLPSTVPDEPFQSGSVGGLDADAGVQDEPTAVIPGQHILGVVGLQEAVAPEVPRHTFSHGVLEALQELVGEGGGFVETEAGFWMGGRILSRVTFNLLEEPVHDAQVVVVVRIEGGAEAVQEAHGPERGAGRGTGTGLPQGSLEGSEEDVEDGAGGPGPVTVKGAGILQESFPAFPAVLRALGAQL